MIRKATKDAATRLGIVAGIAGFEQGNIVSALWPWLLAPLALWLPGSWLLGRFFDEAMRAAGCSLFSISACQRWRRF